MKDDNLKTIKSKSESESSEEYPLNNENTNQHPNLDNNPNPYHKNSIEFYNEVRRNQKMSVEENDS